MAWNSFATPAIGKAVRWASRALHHGGSALPGRVIVTIYTRALTRTLSTLPLGVVIVSGTNGKTSTTRMVASMLADLGLRCSPIRRARTSRAASPPRCSNR